MKKLMAAAMTVAFCAASASAQSLDELNIQIHGYATQGFIYTTQNNILTTNSSDGSPSWSEAVVNVGAQPAPKLRIAVQARYFILGNFGDAITLDFASADYKVNDKLGMRFGKVKTPTGLFNEVQDVDPSYLWSLLPQSVYPITSRNSQLAHYGGVVYGTFKLGSRLGKLEYRGFGGERSYPSDDGVLLSARESGLIFPNGFSGPMFGGAIHWKTPLTGLMIGASDIKQPNWNNTQLTDTIPTLGTFSGTDSTSGNNTQSFFARYEKKRVMVAAEAKRQPTKGVFAVPTLFSTNYRADYRSWYAMASYKLTDKLTAGVYDSQYFDHEAQLGPGRYSKDWALSGRYDFSQFLYAKFEEHFMDGTALSYDANLNPSNTAGVAKLKPDTRMTILKIGVSF